MPDDFSRLGKPVAIMLVRVSQQGPAGSSRLKAAESEALAGSLSRIEALVRTAAGRVVKHIGSALLAVFESVEKAIGAAAALQDEIETTSRAKGFAARVGISCGAMILSGSDVANEALETTTRLVALAGAGEVLLSSSAQAALPPAMQMVARRIREDATAGTVFEYVRHQEDMTFRPMQITRADVLELAITFGTQHFDIGPQRPKLTIGRTEENDITIPQRFVSRNHAEIELRGDKFVLQDQSTNGTFVKPQTGEKVAIRREAFTLTGSGQVFVGSEACPPIAYKVKSAR